MDTLFFLVLPSLIGLGVGVALVRAASAMGERVTDRFTTTDARTILYAFPMSALISAIGIWLIWQMLLSANSGNGSYPTSGGIAAAFLFLGAFGGAGIGLIWNLVRAFRAVES